MRNWIDLVEGRLAPLYHGTSLSAALEMLHTETLHAGSSLSRSYEVAGHFADKTSLKLDDNRHGLTPLGKLEYEADLGTYAIIVFDQARLMHNVGLAPYNWFYGNDTTAPKYERGTEFEEVTKREAKPVSRYIIGIDADHFETFAALVLEKLPEYTGAVEKMRSLLHRQAPRPHTFIKDGGWIISDALQFVRRLAAALPEFDIEIVGSVKTKWKSDKDLDLKLTMNETGEDNDSLEDPVEVAMTKLGATFAGAREDEGYQCWTLSDGRVVDLFFTER